MLASAVDISYITSHGFDIPPHPLAHLSRPLLLLPPLALPLPLILRKPQTHTINAVPLVGRRLVPLALKHVPQMAAAIAAHDLGARHAQAAVRVPRHRARQAVEVRRPAAAAGELVRRLVEGGAAAGAGVDAGGRGMLVVGAGEGGLGALFAEDAELLCGERGIRGVGVERRARETESCGRKGQARFEGWKG